MAITHTVTLINNTHTIGDSQALSIGGDNGYSETILGYQSVQFDLTEIQHDALFIDTLYDLITSGAIIVKLDGTIYTAIQVGQWKYIDTSGVVPSSTGPTWYLVGTQNFIIDLEDVTGTTYGFKVIDTAAEYFQVIRKADAKLDLESALQNISLNASVDFAVTSGGTSGIDATGNLTLDSDAATAIGGASVALEADGGILSLTGDGVNDIDIINAGGIIDVDADVVDIETTDFIELDATGSITIDSDTAASLGGASVALEADGGILSLTGDGVNDIDIVNAGANIDIDADIVDIETTGTLDLDAAGALTLDSDGATALGGASIEIESDGGDISLVSSANISMYAGSGIQLQLSTALADVSAHGWTIEGTTGAATVFGNSLYIDGTGEYVLTDADLAATMPCTALAIDAGGAGAGRLMLMQGVARDDTWTWTPGGTLFASTTSGALTQTAPSGLGDQVQPVGHAISATIIYFNPIRYWHEIV